MVRTEKNYPRNFDEFEEFFRENFQSASLVAYRYIDDRSVIEDIVQESFIRLWEKRSEIYRNHEELKKYLLVTVRNRAISHLRSVKIHRIEIEQSLQDLNLSESEKLYDNEELSIRISKAIKNLPTRCQEIFLLAYNENKTYEEIATQLSISKNTVKTQMGIAYRILRAELKDVYFKLLFLMYREKI